MKVDSSYIRKFINIEAGKSAFKELLASVGLEVAEVIDFEGTPVFEVEITPNRPDWLSHYGIARELHARLPDLDFPPLEFKKFPLDEAAGKEDFSVVIEESRDCGRYAGCIIRNVKVKESPEEIKKLLERLGLRPINNIVDISNVVVLTVGQPIHMFDLDKLRGNQVRVRRGRKGELLKLLNEENIKLGHESLVIADKEGAVALAGIMGGEDSGVTEETKNIFIESAYFDPVVVRKTARKLGLTTDASYRFERGADPLIMEKAIRLAVEMIEDSMGEELGIAYFSDLFPMEFVPNRIELDKDYPSRYTGIEIERGTSEQILRNLGFKIEDKGEKWLVEAPSYRVDIQCKQDLVEEIIRIYGYDNLISRLPKTVSRDFKIDHDRELRKGIRQHAASIGFNEVINYVFCSREENRMFSAEDPEGFVEIRNPLGKDYAALRNSLLPGILKNTALNFNQAFRRVSLIELGTVFSIGNNRIVEREMVAITASGEYLQANWREKEGQKFDFYIFKSLIATLLKRLSLDYKFEREPAPYLQEPCSFAVRLNGCRAGYIGSLKKEILDFYKIEEPLWAAEILFSEIARHLEENNFKMWNKFPASERDFSFLIDKDVGYEKLEAVIDDLRPGTLEHHRLFDLYEGDKIPGDKVALSLSFSYRDSRRTLTNDEVNRIHDDFTGKLMSKLNLIPR